MRILIIEDDQNKRRQLVEFLCNTFPKCCVDEKFSYQSGLKEILRGGYDLILLDMSMPTYDISPNERGGRPRVFGGKEILRQMQRRGLVIPVVIVTQFESFGDADEAVSLSELCEQLGKDYGSIYRGFVYYNAALDNWKRDLEDILNILIKRLKLKGQT